MSRTAASAERALGETPGRSTDGNCSGAIASGAPSTSNGAASTFKTCVGGMVFTSEVSSIQCALSSCKRRSMSSIHVSSNATPLCTTSALGSSGTLGTPSSSSSFMTSLNDPASPRSITGRQSVDVGSGLRSPSRSVVACRSSSCVDSISVSLLILLLLFSCVSITVVPLA